MALKTNCSESVAYFNKYLYFIFTKFISVYHYAYFTFLLLRSMSGMGHTNYDNPNHYYTYLPSRYLLETSYYVGTS